MVLLSVETAEARRVEYPNGDVYVGKWKRKAPNGKGTMQYANGDLYIGYCFDGAQIGVGKMIYGDKSVYEGDWAFGEIRGRGKYTSSKGDVYEGQFLKGKFHGQGVYRCFDGTIYEGNFEYGLKNGEGKQHSPKGDFYEGIWKNDAFYSGRCSYEEANGKAFDGKYSNGKIREGKLITANGNWYKGEWKDGEFYTGECSYTGTAGEKFVGTYKNGWFFKGELTLANESWYKGEWKDGIFYTGECKENNAKRTYEGSYKEGIPYNGVINGELENGDCTSYNGKFVDGLFVGECVIKLSCGVFTGKKEKSVYIGVMDYEEGLHYDGSLDEQMRKMGVGRLISDKNDGILDGEFAADEIVQGQGHFTHSSINYTFTVKSDNEGTYNVMIYKDGKAFLDEKVDRIQSGRVFAQLELLIEQKIEEDQRRKELAESRAFCRKYLKGHTYQANSVSWKSTDAEILMGMMLDVKVVLKFISEDKAQYTVYMRTTNALDDNPYVWMQFESICNKLDGTTETVDYKYLDGVLYIGDVRCETGNNLKNIHYDMDIFTCWLKQVK